VSTVPYKMQATQPSERNFRFVIRKAMFYISETASHLPSIEQNVRVKMRPKILAGLILCHSLLLLCSCRLLQHY
jgi:hypothetical protein